MQLPPQPIHRTCPREGLPRCSRISGSPKYTSTNIPSSRIGPLKPFTHAASLKRRKPENKRPKLELSETRKVFSRR